MAKKIRFPLEMEQGVEVRSMEELRENFSLSRVLVYLSNGKLVTWLRDRYFDDIADAIEELNTEDDALPQKVCKIFEVEYNEQDTIDLKKAEERNRKQDILKQYTTEQRFFHDVDRIAFTQDDVYDLLDEEETVIYLCGEKFAIPLSKKGITYVGVNNPVVVVDSKKVIDWNEKRITLFNVKYDSGYQQVMDRDRQTKGNNDYSKESYLNFMLSTSDKAEAKCYYEKLINLIEKLHYDIDGDVKNVKQELLDAGIAGLADNYLNNL